MWLLPDNTDADALVRLAASLEVASEHPLGEAIVAKAKEQGASFDEVTNFEAIPGFGIKGHVGETLVFLGNEKWMRENGLVNVEMNDKPIILPNKEKHRSISVIMMPYKA